MKRVMCILVAVHLAVFLGVAGNARVSLMEVSDSRAVDAESGVSLKDREVEHLNRLDNASGLQAQTRASTFDPDSGCLRSYLAALNLPVASEPEAQSTPVPGPVILVLVGAGLLCVAGLWRWRRWF